MRDSPDVDSTDSARDAGAPLADPGAQVKTLTFTTLRSFLPAYFDAEAYQQIRAGLATEALNLLDEAEPGGWAAEGQMQEVLHAVYDRALQADDVAFVEFARALAAAGISRFMQIFLSLASARFVLRRVPVVWDRLRRNAGTVTTEVEPGVVRICYAGFPFFADKLYQLLSMSNCQALAFAATRKIPTCRVVSSSRDSLVLEFEVDP